MDKGLLSDLTLCFHAWQHENITSVQSNGLSECNEDYNLVLTPSCNFTSFNEILSYQSMFFGVFFVEFIIELQNFLLFLFHFLKFIVVY